MSDCIIVNTEFDRVVVRPVKPVQSDARRDARREERERCFRNIVGPGRSMADSHSPRV